MKKFSGHMIFSFTVLLAFITFISFYESKMDVPDPAKPSLASGDSQVVIDTLKIPNDQFGEAVKYGRQLLLNTAYYIGPEGVNGKYLGNKMNCSSCHQEAGTKLYSFNLIASHQNYPQYRARENKVLTLAERVNNCVMRPHNGKPLPLDGKEMVAILSYLKWINSFAPKEKSFKGLKNLEVKFPAIAASSGRGQNLYTANCLRCHGANGEGVMKTDNSSFLYPPLWGANSYQPGSSMHRIIKQAQWVKANMPYDKATWNKPVLTDEEALDIAAFINDDNIHKRPGAKNLDYPNPAKKAIDYAEGPFVDSFSTVQHKVGPFEPVISYWKSKGWEPVY